MEKMKQRMTTDIKAKVAEQYLIQGYKEHAAHSRYNTA